MRLPLNVTAVPALTEYFEHSPRFTSTAAFAMGVMIRAAAVIPARNIFGVMMCLVVCFNCDDF